MTLYMSGFANHFSTEAVASALPVGRNSPQRPHFGLYAEQLSGTAFTAPRGDNRRSWLYRIRPSAEHPPFTLWREGAPLEGATPNRLRWDPPTFPSGKVDFVDGLTLWAGAGDPARGEGLAIHLYAATVSMVKRAFASAEGEWLIVPQQGGLLIVTEMGRLRIDPGSVALLPRGMKFRVELTESEARGYVCENFGAPFRLPELGPIGSNGLANVRDFETPVAAFEDVDEPCQMIHKFGGHLWTATLDHSPFDVVAWHGNLAPCRYDLARFNTIGTVSFDHPDPSLFTVLTSPSDTPGTANCDFVVFPPRWLVAEDTFRPPWYHRNVMSEFMGLIQGGYDAKEGGFDPGGSSVHPMFSAHGPDRASHRRASLDDLEPRRLDDSLAFMFESRLPIRPSCAALASPLLQNDYDTCWNVFEKARLP